MAEGRAYYYETEIEWKGEKHGDLRAKSVSPIVVGAPPEFKGREGDWSPEQLFVASLNTCYMLTFLAIAEFSKVFILTTHQLLKESWKR